jgi:oxygen-dependent protoporphyrinogen oxidase
MLVELEREHGGLVRGGLARMFGRRRTAAVEESVVPKASRGRPGSWSARGGLASLAEGIAAGLPEPPLLGSRVARLSRDGSDWRAEVVGDSGDQIVRAGSVVVATSAYAAAELFESLDGELSKLLAAIEYAPIVTVAFGVDPSDVEGEVEGFGFIVPRAAQLQLLGCLFMSRLFEARAPAGHELLQLMLGGVRWPDAVRASDDELIERAASDLDRCLGLRASPRTLAIRRWPRAIPQPGREHVRLIAEVQRRVAELPQVALAGSYLAGISVADTLASGVRAASALAGPPD